MQNGVAALASMGGCASIAFTRPSGSLSNQLLARMRPTTCTVLPAPVSMRIPPEPVTIVEIDWTVDGERPVEETLDRRAGLDTAARSRQ